MQFKQTDIEFCPYKGLYVLRYMKIIHKSIENNGIYSSQITEIINLNNNKYLPCHAFGAQSSAIVSRILSYGTILTW